MRSRARAITLAGLLGAALPASAAAQWPPQQPGGTPYGATPMPAGGLGAAPVVPAPGVRETERLLDEAKVEDAGRRLEWLWLDVQAGFAQLGLQSLKGDRSLTGGFVPTSSSGGVLSAGLGVRLLFLTLLARGRVGLSSVGQLYELGGEAGFHVPLGHLEPHLQLGAGYATMAHLHDDVSGAAASLIGLRGFYARAGGGLDVFVLPVLSLGVDVSAELLGLHRAALGEGEVAALKSSPGLSAAQQSSADLLRAEASSLGGVLSATAVLGLHL